MVDRFRDGMVGELGALAVLAIAWLLVRALRADAYDEGYSDGELAGYAAGLRPEAAPDELPADDR